MTGAHRPMGPDHVTLFRVIVPVSNIQQADAFYSSALGLRAKPISPGRRYFDCGGVILACYDAEADGDSQKPVPLSEPLYFAVDDLPAAYDRCKRAGAHFSSQSPPGVGPLAAITMRPWGEESFYVEDLFGNPLCFVSAATALQGS